MAKTGSPPGGVLPWTMPVIGVNAATKIIGFWHIGAVGDWRRIVAEQYEKLKASGLYDASAKIVVGFIGGKRPGNDLPASLARDPKFEVFATADVEDFEFPTLARVWQEATESAVPFRCYYLHTKGASLAGTPKQAAVEAWRAYMEYFNIERWADSAAILDDYDTCGVELQSEASHYSGNFWWATSEYVRKLPDACRYWEENRNNRVAAEFYLCLAQPRAYCFHDFVEDLYDYVVPPGRYRGGTGLLPGRGK